jgi:ABC-type lipoprotein export system ATPase subunit
LTIPIANNSRVKLRFSRFDFAVNGLTGVRQSKHYLEMRQLGARPSMIKLTHVNRQFIINAKANIVIQALSDIRLVFRETGLTMILGRSGSGKTTLLNVIGGIDRPDSGSVLYDGTSLYHRSPHEIDHYRNGHIAYVFQDYHLLHEYNVIDNIKVALRLQSNDKDAIDQKAKEALKVVGLEGFDKRKINTLSGGQQQRVVIARAVAKDSRVLLCDEPTGNLDSASADEIMALFREIAENRLVIMVTHDEKLAVQYATRIIRLKDGRVESDTDENQPSPPLSDQPMPFKAYRGLTLKDAGRMVFDNILGSAFVSVVLLFLFITALSLTIVFASLSGYDKMESYLNTLRQNEQYVLQISKFVDRPVIYPINGEDVVMHGPKMYYEDVKFEDIEWLSALVEQRASFYPSYFMNKNLQDFADFPISTNKTTYPYVQIAFREAIAVEDFTTFFQKLRYGSMPVDDDDVLLYDYMVYSMIRHGLLSGTIESNVGTVLTDAHTNLTLRIAGILESDYERYAYLEDSFVENHFEETYLTSLQSIFCKPSWILRLAAEETYISILKGFFVIQTGGDARITDAEIKKIRSVSLTDYDFLDQTNGFREGILLSEDEVERYFGMSWSALDEAARVSFLETVTMILVMPYYDRDIERTYYTTRGYPILGVVNEPSSLEGTLLMVEQRPEERVLRNGTFRQIYLSLGRDWKENFKVLNLFQYERQTDAFYLEHPDFYIEGYVDYNAYGVWIQKADSYLRDVKGIASDLTAILIVSTSVGIMFFALHSIKKYAHKIGVLKAMGTHNEDIALVFGAQIACIAMAAYGLSIPISMIVMTRINREFVTDIHPELVFFGWSSASALIVLLGMLMVLVASSAVPLIRLLNTSPYRIIRTHSRHS